MPYKDPAKRKKASQKGSRKYFLKNKDEMAEKQRLSRHAFSRKWREYKSSVKCAYCGFSHPAAIDFHHPPGTKKYHINELVKRRAEKLLFEEIAKCVPLCANCHRIHHFNLIQERRRKKAKKKGAEAP